jgi:hypothetical protein
MAITGSKDRDHARLTFLCWSGHGGQVKRCRQRVGPFFCSTRAGSILASRPQLSLPTRAGSVTAGRSFAVTRQGLALTGPRTPAPLIARGGSRLLLFAGAAAQAVALEFDAMGVVNDAVQYRITEGGIGNDVVPLRHGDLACDQE